MDNKKKILTSTIESKNNDNEERCNIASGGSQTFIQTDMPGFVLRFAAPDDADIILFFIMELAKYENMENEVVATVQNLRETLFERKFAEVILAEYEGKTVGFFLFFHIYSTFLGQPGIYLEDLYLMPEVRKKGFGKKIFAYLAHLAVERGCGRIEWSCLDWNTPSRKFYESLGSKLKDDWVGYRLSGREMTDLADKAGSFLHFH